MGRCFSFTRFHQTHRMPERRPTAVGQTDDHIKMRESLTRRFWLAAVCIVLISTASISCKKSGGIQWVDPAKLHQGPVQHATLPGSQMEWITRLQQTFVDVDPSPIEKWVDDFKRDFDPERELRIYECMAEAYRGYCSDRNLSPVAKADVYQVVLLRSGAPVPEVLPRLKLRELSVADAKQVLALYKEPAVPITVVPSPANQ